MKLQKEEEEGKYDEGLQSEDRRMSERERKEENTYFFFWYMFHRFSDTNMCKCSVSGSGCQVPQQTSHYTTKY